LRNLNLKWVERSLFLEGRHVSTVATHEWERGVYSVWSHLPGGDEPENIKGLAKARKVAEASVRKWFDEVLLDV
jgi:hypothetical protein